MRMVVSKGQNLSKESREVLRLSGRTCMSLAVTNHVMITPQNALSFMEGAREIVLNEID